jgi:hypothetical protein
VELPDGNPSPVPDEPFPHRGGRAGLGVRPRSSTTGCGGGTGLPAGPKGLRRRGNTPLPTLPPSRGKGLTIPP